MNSFIAAAVISMTAGQTLLIDQGGGTWKEGGVSDLPRNRVVRVVYLDAGTVPDKPTDPVPDPTSLKDITQQGALVINEPLTAQALALGYSTIAGQIEVGTANQKLLIVQAQKEANALLLTSSSKVAEWNTLLDKTWAHLDGLEAQGKTPTPASMAPYWREIEAGLKGSANAEWELNTDANLGPIFPRNREPREMDPDRWKLIIQLILQIVLRIFGGD